MPKSLVADKKRFEQMAEPKKNLAAARGLDPDLLIRGLAARGGSMRPRAGSHSEAPASPRDEAVHAAEEEHVVVSTAPKRAPPSRPVPVAEAAWSPQVGRHTASPAASPSQSPSPAAPEVVPSVPAKPRAGSFSLPKRSASARATPSPSAQSPPVSPKESAAGGPPKRRPPKLEEVDAPAAVTEHVSPRVGPVVAAPATVQASPLTHPTRTRAHSKTGRKPPSSGRAVRRKDSVSQLEEEQDEEQEISIRGTEETAQDAERENLEADWVLVNVKLSLLERAAAQLSFLPPQLEPEKAVVPADASSVRGNRLAGLRAMGGKHDLRDLSTPSNDQLFLWDENTVAPVSVPLPLGGVNVKSVAAGRAHFLLLTDEGGKVFSWGAGKSGALGFGDAHNSSQARPIESLSCIQSIAAGGDQSGCVSQDNQLFLWGSGGDGKAILSPARAPLEVKVEKLALGTDFYVISDSKGQVSAWGGSNDEGQTCGPGGKLAVPEFVSEVSACGKTAAVLTAEGSVYWWGRGAGTKPMRLPLTKKAKQAAAGNGFVLALSFDGLVFGIGRNESGQLSETLPELVSTVTVLKILEDEGEVNAEAEEEKRSLFSKKKSGKQVTQHQQHQQQQQQQTKHAVSGPVYVKSVSVGFTHAAALTSQGTVVRWGRLYGSSGGVVSDHAIAAVPMAAVTCGENSLAAVLALKSSEDLKFSSYSPPVVEAATLDKLVDWLIDAPGDDFTNSFLLTFYTFVSPSELVALLKDRFELAVRLGNSGLKRKILKVVLQWIAIGPSDFEEPSLSGVVEDLCRMSGTDEYGRILMAELALPKRIVQVPTGSADVSVQVFQFSALAVAEQLTIIDRALLSRVRTSGIVLLREDSNALSAIVDRFARLVAFISSTLVRQDSRDARSRAASFWIEVQRHLLLLANYEAAAVIGAAFASPDISALLQSGTMELKASALRQLQDFSAMFGSGRRGYRAAVASAMQEGIAFVPLLAVLLADVASVRSSHSDGVGGKLINFKKRRLLAEHCKMMTAAQRSGPAGHFVAIDDLIGLLSKCECPSATEQHEAVLRIVNKTKEPEPLAEWKQGKRVDTLHRWLESPPLAQTWNDNLVVLVSSIVDEPPVPSGEERKLIDALFAKQLCGGVSGEKVTAFLIGLSQSDPEPEIVHHVAHLLSRISDVQGDSSLTEEDVNAVKRRLFDPANEAVVNDLQRQQEEAASLRDAKRDERDCRMTNMEDKIATLKAQLEQIEKEAEAYRRASGLELRGLETRFKVIDREASEKAQQLGSQKHVRDLFDVICFFPAQEEEKTAAEMSRFLFDLQQLSSQHAAAQNDAARQAELAVAFGALKLEYDHFVQSKKSLSEKLQRMDSEIREVVLKSPVAKPTGCKTATVVETVQAIFRHDPEEEGELFFDVGDIIHVIRKHKSGWSKGFVDGKPDVVGLFPHSYTGPLSFE